MVVLVLGDNFEFFPAILTIPIVSFHVHLNLSHKLQWNDTSSSVRDSLMIKNLYLCTNSSSTKLFLKWRNNMVLSNTSRECTCTYELTDVHHCIKVDFPCGCFGCLFTTSFHSFSTAAFASGINIAWSERSVAHTLGFPRQASLRDRSPELSEPFVTLGFPPGFWELLEEFCPTDTLCRETTQHAPAFTSTIWQLGEELSFRSFHWDEFVHQIVTLHRIPSISCNTNTNEFCFRHFSCCYFGTTFSRMNVRFPKF